MPVYFVQAGENGPIKIGYASDVAKRIGHLQTSAPDRLCVLSVMDGGEAEEKALHAELAAHRRLGEWFNPTAEVLAAAGRGVGLEPRIDGRRFAQRRHFDHAAIRQIEARLAERGESVASVCRRANIDRSTWHRWKHNAVTPREDQWSRVLAALPFTVESQEAA